MRLPIAPVVLALAFATPLLTSVSASFFAISGQTGIFMHIQIALSRNSFMNFTEMMNGTEIS